MGTSQHPRFMMQKTLSQVQTDYLLYIIGATLTLEFQNVWNALDLNQEGLSFKINGRAFNLCFLITLSTCKFVMGEKEDWREIEWNLYIWNTLIQFCSISGRSKKLIRCSASLPVHFVGINLQISRLIFECVHGLVGHEWIRSMLQCIVLFGVLSICMSGLSIAQHCQSTGTVIPSSMSCYWQMMYLSC